jgi:hypothetical protein
VTIEREGELFIVDNNKHIEFMLKHLEYSSKSDNVSSKEAINEEKQRIKDFNSTKNYIGLIINANGTLSPANDLALGLYGCQKKENIFLINYHNEHTNLKYVLFDADLIDVKKAILLIDKTQLSKIDILENNKVNKDLCIESFYQNKKSIAKEKYIIKITQEELNKALEELDEVSEK